MNTNKLILFMPQDLHTMISFFTFSFCKPIPGFHHYIRHCHPSDIIDLSDTSRTTPPSTLLDSLMGLLPYMLTF